MEDGDHAYSFFKYKLDFIHRTVRDFLSTSEEVKEQLRSELMNDRRTTWILAWYALHSLFQVAPYMSSQLQEGEFIQTIVKDLYYYSSRARHYGDRSISEEEAKNLVDTGEARCEQRIQTFNKNKNRPTKLQHPHRLFLCLDAQYNFSGNLNKRINKYGKSLKMSRDGGRPVLDCALVEIPGEGPLRYSERVVKVLLSSGAERKCVYHKMTVWQRFIVHLARHRSKRVLRIDRHLLRF